MMNRDEDNIDFTQLEKELCNEIEVDARYWRENDAKLRAIKQKVGTYEDFRDIVKAAHLRPLDKNEKIHSSGKSRSSSIWNSLATKIKVSSDEATSIPTSTSLHVMDPDRLPSTIQEFCHIWNCLDISERLSLLRRLGPSWLGHLFRCEIPVGVLGEVLQALLAFTPSTQEIVMVVAILEALTHAKRFSLSLQFLSSVEQSVCRQLLEKLETSLEGRQQDLAEEEVTEWTLQQLKIKYQISVQ